jgi:hypothetical protein
MNSKLKFHDKNHKYYFNFRRSSRKTTNGSATMDHSQHVSVGRHSIIELRFRSSAVANDQPNWCLHCPRHRKNGKRDIKKIPHIKSNLLKIFF